MDKEQFRIELVTTAYGLIQVPYEWGAKWTDFTQYPKKLDCSGEVSGVYNYCSNINNFDCKMPDGGQQQYYFCIPTTTPKPGDLGFFAYEGNPTRIYHVGMILDDKNMIEARGPDEHASFKTGCVILRERKYWEAWKNFMGYRCHPKLRD